MKFRFTIWIALVSVLLISTGVSANLLIYPVRVSFDETERSAQLNLTNTSSVTYTYRLEWRENQALTEGGYKVLSEDEAKDSPTASGMLRFSPRQVTLRPGERQLIKLSLRRPRNLAEGEYRSHLLLKALPPQLPAEAADGTSMRINMVMSFAVPVSVQQGTYEVDVELKDAEIRFDPANNTGQVMVTMGRTGIHSASGDLTAYWTPVGGKEILLAKLADYNLWAELDEAKASLIWAASDFKPADGTLRISYEGVRDFKGNEYLEQTLNIDKSQISTVR